MKDTIAVLVCENTSTLTQIFGKRFMYHNILVDEKITRTFPTVVIESLCRRCLQCEPTCHALKYNHTKRVMSTNEIGCKGCGMCITICQMQALQHRTTFFPIPTSLDITCNFCAWRCDTIKNLETFHTPIPRIRFLCSGRVEPVWILDAFESGCDGVIVIGCYFESFNFSRNEPIVKKRIQISRQLMNLLGFEKYRLQTYLLSVYDETLKNIIENFADRLK
jgi:coenzyme F420-reducing hydrogenase delta subunit/Pyruvate/2-oxoacid:ferredoxin oxidoreductase delta subunit